MGGGGAEYAACEKAIWGTQRGFWTCGRRRPTECSGDRDEPLFDHRQEAECRLLVSWPKPRGSASVVPDLDRPARYTRCWPVGRKRSWDGPRVSVRVGRVPEAVRLR